MKSFAPASTAWSRCSLRREARDHDHGNVAAGGILPDTAAHVEPVESGHDDVEQHEIDAKLQLGEPLDAVASGLDLVTEGFDEHLRDCANSLVVIDDEDATASESGRQIRRRWRVGCCVSSAFAPADEGLADRVDVRLQFFDERSGIVQRATTRDLDEIDAAACDRVGADDRHAALQ